MAHDRGAGDTGTDTRTAAPRAPLPRDARVAIMGAGCAGLTCAEELRERGYRAVTVFDAAPRAGGKIRSVPYAGAPRGGRGLFEAGTVFFIPSPVWTKLLRRHGVPAACAPMPRVRIADLSSPGAGAPRVASPLAFAGGYALLDRLGQVARLFALLGRHGPAHDARPGLAPHVAPELCAPAGAWLERQGLAFVRDVLLPIVAAAQFGPLVDTVPALYVLRMLTMLRRFGLGARVGLQIPQLRAGHEALWARVAAAHGARTGEPVTRIARDAREGVVIETPRGREAFDALIVAAPPERYLAAAGDDATAEERELFARVRTLDRVVLTARVRGLPRDVFYAVRYAADGAVPPAHPYLFYEVDRGGELFTFHPFLDGGRDAGDAERAATRLVERLGGTLVSFEHRAVVRGWFPHFGEQDLRAGVYQRLEALQGARRTWFAGELFAGIGVPHGMEYAASLVANAIARDGTTARG